MDARTESTEINCKEFEKMIPDFIAQKMDYPTMKGFISHMEQCRDCKEELSIQFLVIEGIQRLEDGNAFDLQAELEQRLLAARQKIKFHNAFMSLGFAMEIIAVCLLAGIIVWILL